MFLKISHVYPLEAFRMKQGIWIRILCVLVILWPFLNHVQAQNRLFYLQARKLDDPDKTVLRKLHKDTIMVSQMLAIEVFVVFENKDNEDYKYSLLYNDETELPLYFGSWQNKTMTSTQKGAVDTLRNILYLRPTEAGPLNFKITGLLEEKFGKIGYYQEFEIEVTEAVADLIPVLYPDSAEAELGYSHGYSKTIAWKPAASQINTLAQEAYAFSTDDPRTLFHSARRLYRLSSQAHKTTTFENLQDGQEYGYFAKADYMSERGPISVYSDLYLCTQDNSPPETVAEPIVVAEPTGYRISWDAVDDAVSGVEDYLIYRASDTGAEALIQTVASQINPFYIWIDQDVDLEIKYYYRVRARDRVGNIGDGVRTEAVDASTEEPTTQEIDYPDYEPAEDLGIRYVSGSVDTIWLNHPVNLDSIRVISVRDDKSFFTDPPDLGMRVFDSPVITAPFPPYWAFDYGFKGPVETTPAGTVVRGEGGIIDLNFVNGHTYYPVVIYYKRHENTVIDSLKPRIMDCFDPEDIRNLYVQSMVSGETDRYEQWKMQLFWDKPADDQASPVRAYHVYRRTDDQESFSQIASLSVNQTAYIDESLKTRMNPLNPVVTYRVVAEDSVGHRRQVENCAWEGSDRVLNAPDLKFEVRYSLEKVIRDTIYTHADSVILEFQNFDWNATDQFIVSVNDNSRLVLNPKDGYIPIALDENLFTSVIKLRAVYKGGRSSVWSEPVIAVRDTVPPSVLTVQNHPDSSFGHIYLQWDRTSQAAEKYYVYRSSDGEKFMRVATVSASQDTLRWTDREHLVLYHYYTYKVQPYTKTNRLGPFSNKDRDYCNRPPTIFKHSVTERSPGQFEIQFVWNRGWPTDIPNSFVTDVYIYEDNYSQFLLKDINSTEPMDTSFTYYDGYFSHNYIFQLREKLDNDSLNRTSGLSLPYTISLKTLEMEALTQPYKKIFLAWDHKVTDTLDVIAFHLIRSEDRQVQLDTLISPNQFTFMDEDASLKHNHSYHYRLIALNQYQQILAANDTTVLCDSSLVYIPTIKPLPAYFNTRSIPICWYWQQNGVMDTTTTRGARDLTLQISTKSSFPMSPAGQTVVYEFQADPAVRCGHYTIPENAGNVNSQLFIRMFATDKWGNPVPRIESRRRTTNYDAVHPLLVESFQVNRIQALETTTDSVIVYLSWTDTSITDQNDLVSNVIQYRILREWSGQEAVAALVPTVPQQYSYAILDTVPNLNHSWRLISMDGATNETTNGWIQAPVFVETPAVLNFTPLDFRSCQIQGMPDVVQEYLVEVAMFENHFQLAHELGGDQLELLLCRSGWLPVQQDTFQCTSGWGAHFSMDTTYFRVKTRQGEQWESGWSALQIFYSSIDKEGQMSHIDQQLMIPKTFEVDPNYPNPFNAGTSIQYGLPESGQVVVRIYNCRGGLVRQLVEDEQTAGYHTCRWDGQTRMGATAASGVYIYEVQLNTKTGLQHRSRMKMMLLK